MAFNLPIDGSMFSWSKTYQVLFWLLMIGVLAGTVWFGGRLTQYSYRVTIHDRRGQQGLVEKIDAGRVKKMENGTLSLHIRKENCDLLLPDRFAVHQINYSIFNPFQNKGVTLYQYGEKTFTFVNVMEELGESIEKNRLRFVPEEQKASRAKAMFEAQKNKFVVQDWFVKWGPLVISGLMFATLVIMMIFVLKGMENVVPAFNSAAAQFTHAAELLSKCNVAPTTALG